MSNITSTARPFWDLSITNNELYFFGYLGFIIALILLCACCIGCKKFCCRACCFARETRTRIPLPKKVTTAAGLNVVHPNPGHRILPIEPLINQVQCRTISIDCECNCSGSSNGCECDRGRRDRHSCRRAQCYECRDQPESRCNPNRSASNGCECDKGRRDHHYCRRAQCYECRVQPESRCKVDKATATGGVPNRSEFEYLHGMSSQMRQENGGNVGHGPLISQSTVHPNGRTNPSCPPQKTYRAPQPPSAGNVGFTMPKPAWSYPNPPSNNQTQRNLEDESWE